MILDTSAIYAIITKEPGYLLYVEALEKDRIRLVSAGTLYEAAVVLFGVSGNHTLVDDLREFIRGMDIHIVPFDTESAWRSLQAYTRFGKGFHRARLNLMDCIAYQLAQQFNDALLFKGDDFRRTDVRAAVD